MKKKRENDPHDHHEEECTEKNETVNDKRAKNNKTQKSQKIKNQSNWDRCYVLRAKSVQGLTDNIAGTV